MMMPLPTDPPSSNLIAWRIDRSAYAARWDSGEGARIAGGRWNSKGRAVVYCSADPATAILEVAIHRGFAVLDAIPHTLTCLEIDPNGIEACHPADLPNPAWLHPGSPGAGQQAFGDAVLRRFGSGVALLPSVVSTHSWNIIFDPQRAAGRYTLKYQERLAIDPRLNPPSA